MAAPVGTVLLPSEGHCQHAGDCCPQGGVCDDGCVACACCPGAFSGMPSPVILLELAGVPPTPAMSTASRAVLPLFSADILHVPKSV